MKFTFLKIPVLIHPSFWISLVFFVGIYDSLTYEKLILGVIFIFSLLFHEYGHGLTAQYFGKNPKIDLVAFGGYTSYYDSSLTKKQRFLITLNGPLFTGILILLSYYLLKSNIFLNYYMRYFLYVTMRLNIFWGIINLIPIYPLDGGKLLAYILETSFGQKGLKISLFIGNISAILACIYGFGNNYYIIGYLSLIYGFQNLQKYYQVGFGSHKKNNYTLYNDSLKAIENNQTKKAKTILRKLLKAKDNNIKISATETLANVLYKENENKKAYDLLLKSDHKLLKTGKCLLCKLAFVEKNYILIEKYSQEIYQIDPSYEIALLNSKSFALLNNPKYSAGWLKTASLFENVKKKTLKEILQDKMFDNVRNDKTFKQHTKTIFK